MQMKSVHRDLVPAIGVGPYRQVFGETVSFMIVHKVAAEIRDPVWDQEAQFGILRLAES